MATRNKTVLSQAEKREIYVRRGWVDAYNIGQLIEWLDGQQHNEKPDEPMWRKLLSDQNFGLRRRIDEDVRVRGPGIVITEVAEPCLPRSDNVLEFIRALGQPERWLAHHLDSGIKTVPIGSSRLVLASVSLDPSACTIHHEEGDDEAYILGLSGSDVFDAAMDSWSRGSPLRDQARLFLCRHAGWAILDMRNRAEVAFDTSVAVSDDGQRVLAADYVVVYGYDAKRQLTFRSFQSVAFLLHKIRLGQPHVIRRPAPKRQQTEEQIMQSVLKPREVKKVVQETLKFKRTQCLLQIGGIRTLFIDKSQIPAGLQPAVCTTAPAPPATSTMPSPSGETAPSDPIPEAEPCHPEVAGSGFAPPEFQESGSPSDVPPEPSPDFKGLLCPPFDPGDD